MISTFRYNRCSTKNERNNKQILILFILYEKLIFSEEQVFEACMRWVKHHESRSEYLPELLSEVRLPLLTPLYLTDRVATEELIRSSHQCRLSLETYQI